MPAFVEQIGFWPDRSVFVKMPAGDERGNISITRVRQYNRGNLIIITPH